ncbi:MAG TPA: DNA polymerase III subunit [Vicinamibacterales bacterium]|nr:DNA polymerase III subunit [Vicinamibacterales bacterium]
MPFRDVVGRFGQRRLAELLARSVARDALPPSLIFSGPAAAGMRGMAIAVAQTLNCLTPTKTEGTIDACGTCTVCMRIARGVHPDVIVVEPGDSGAIKVDQIRDVIERAGFRPFEGRRRVVVVDDADVMVAGAQNALLKTLEEPPPSSIFILATTRPDMLLPTVQSRCPRLRFQSAEREAIDDDALEIARDVLAQAAATDDPGRRIDAAKDLLAKTGAGGRTDREQLASHLQAMAAVLRDVEVLSTRANADALANAGLQADLDRLAKSFGGARGVRAFAAVDEALGALTRNAGVKVVADWLVLQL